MTTRCDPTGASPWYLSALKKRRVSLSIRLCLSKRAGAPARRDTCASTALPRRSPPPSPDHVLPRQLLRVGSVAFEWTRWQSSLVMPRSRGPVGRLLAVRARKQENLPLLLSLPGAVDLSSVLTPRTIVSVGRYITPDTFRRQSISGRRVPNTHDVVEH